MDILVLVEQIRDLDVTVQLQLIEAATQGYEPFTLRGSGLFHLAFGALLTGAAITRGNDGIVYGKEGATYLRRAEDFNRLKETKSKSTSEDEYRE